MPTVIVIDVSLSMMRRIPRKHAPEILSEEDIPTRKKLVIEAVEQFLDHVSAHSKLEFVTLLTFSTLFEVVVEFTRELDTIRSALSTITFHDQSNYEAMMEGIQTVVETQWGFQVPVQIVLITDGCPGTGSGSLTQIMKRLNPFTFPAKMNILSLSDSEDKNYTENCQLLQKLIDVTCGDGLVYFPEMHLNSKGCSSAVAQLCAKDFTPYKGSLRCGKLSSKITLCPPPQPFVSRSDERRYEISINIDILGLIDSSDLASPPAHSRHLLLPLKTTDSLPTPLQTVNTKKEEALDDDADGRIPNFCVLLHGALKIESLCAICQVGPEWYGFIYSWADNKKKSNLMLSILPPGTNVVPWLGKMHNLGPKDELFTSLGRSHSTHTSQAEDKKPFPVKSEDKKSYCANPTVWLTTAGINTDIQKLLRHARKLPEKTSQFYKELNRMRGWALCLGFTEILESMAQVLERECMVTTAAHPEATIQLTHAASQLRTLSPHVRSIQALRQ